MKVPYYNTGFKPFISRLTALKEGSAGMERIRSLNSGRFNAVLDAEMKATGAKDDLYLKKNKLQLLVQIVQKQIDNFLICSVLEAYGNNRFSGSLSDGMKKFLTSSMSENRHPLQQEKDAVQSPYNIGRIINHASEEHEVDPKLIRAVIKAESDFDTKSTSDKGAMGLMQLMPETARDLGVKNPYDPAENVKGGTRYLKILLDRYDGNTNLALAAYNWGMGNVERHPGRLPQETKVYIARVNKYYRQATS